jgi:predicted AAA+ superfamily ATPase
VDDLKRLLMQNLIEWKENANKKPLILQGVRQCGKTYLLQEFGRKYYDDVAYYKFDTDEELANFFHPNIHPHRIIEDLSLARKKTIRPGKTLVVFDEIQACYAALTSLKYFYEEAPEYHIVAAGSLLGIAKPEPPYSFPVGKVDALVLRPMNFQEFLIANGEELLCERVNSDGDFSNFSQKLQGYLKKYYIVGGMPEVVKDWVDNKDIEQVDKIQRNILNNYEVDFAKHAPKSDFPKISAIWNGLPKQLAKENRKFIFSQVKSSWRAKDLEDALWWLIRAGMTHKVDLVENPRMPLKAYASDTYFKLYACDIGLMRRLADVDPSVILDASRNFREFKGAMAENYALCELVGLYDNIFFWRSGNKAEVDFLVQDGSDIVPIEVKAESASHAYSLAEYCRKYAPAKSVVTSQEHKNGTIPLYVLWTLKQWLAGKPSSGT